MIPHNRRAVKSHWVAKRVSSLENEVWGLHVSSHLWLGLLEATSPPAWPTVTVLCVIHCYGAPAACVVENNALDFNQSCCQALTPFFCASLSSREKNFLWSSFYTNLPDTLRFCNSWSCWAGFCLTLNLLPPISWPQVHHMCNQELEMVYRILDSRHQCNLWSIKVTKSIYMPSLGLPGSNHIAQILTELSYCMSDHCIP